MSPEASENKYVETVSQVFKETMKGLDPAKFDEQALRKEFKDKLDQAVGKRTLSAEQLNKYIEATKKIDECIARLKDQVELVKIESFLKSDQMKVIDPARKRSFVYEVMVSDFQTMDRIIRTPKPAVMAAVDNFREAGRAEAARDGLAKELQTYLGNMVTSEMDKVAAAEKRMKENSFRINDYLDLEGTIDILQTLIDDKQNYLNGHNYNTSGIDSKFVRARRVLADTAPRMPEFLASLGDEDQKAITNRDKALFAAQKRGDVLSSREVDLAFKDVQALAARQEAKRNALAAMMVSSRSGVKVVDMPTYQNANVLLAEGEKFLQQKKPDLAYRRFNESRDLYQLYIVQQNIAGRQMDLRGLRLATGDKYAAAEDLLKQAGEKQKEGDLRGAADAYETALAAYDRIYTTRGAQQKSGPRGTAGGDDRLASM